MRPCCRAPDSRALFCDPPPKRPLPRQRPPLARGIGRAASRFVYEMPLASGGPLRGEPFFVTDRADLASVKVPKPLGAIRAPAAALVAAHGLRVVG
jgi:hypothetical protein